MNDLVSVPADTRQRLIEAGLDIFGRVGFEAASTRRIAETAGANLAAIKYHFGGKQGLYLAVARHIAEHVSRNVGGAAEAARAALASGRLDRSSAADALEGVVLLAAQNLVANPEAARWARFILREQFEPTEAFELIYSTTMSRLHGTVTALVAIILGLKSESEEAKLEAFALVGQVLVFRLARAAVLRRMEWDDVGPRQAEAIFALLRRSVRRLAAKTGRR
ncbi:MAG: CerR family C-terminal domain-containing protein [Parvibaculaceae bacterium]